jgi:hypothetical protein
MQFNQTNNGNGIFTNSRTVTAPNVHTILSEGGERPIRRLINEDNNVCHGAGFRLTSVSLPCG